MKWFIDFFTKKSTTTVRAPQIFFTNTLSGKKELFIPQKPGMVSMYTCGPTVYGPAHIGNLRAYVFSDTIARTLEEAGYHTRRVINITDVGHMVGDGDSGEDKMAVGAAREKKTPQEIADLYTKEFLSNLNELNIDIKNIQFPRATDYIKEQIALAKTLEEKGFAYRIKNGLAFDISRFPGYGKLGNIDISAQRIGARVETDSEKRNPSDFWLWRNAKPNDLQQWDSPWGRGNPGWHIECSAMSRALLGQGIDIHTGGEDHIATHHNNEIAQSEAATGREFVHYWMHNAFLTVEGHKISKSLHNDIYLKDITEKKYSPYALRYFFLQAHYRTPLSFSWDALVGATSALKRLQKLAHDIAGESERKGSSSDAQSRFLAVLREDLATPQALGILWDSLKSDEYTPEEKWKLIEIADKHFGLSLMNTENVETLTNAEIPAEIHDMIARREAARKSKDFKLADQIRDDIEHSGYCIEDGPNGQVLTQSTF